MSDYFVRGADGVDYPATLENVRAWLGEGRITRDQYVYDSRAAQWVTVDALLAQGVAATPAAAAPAANPGYHVRGADGTNYPADLPTLRVWAGQGRLEPRQLVYDTQAAQWVTADQILGMMAFPQGQQVPAAVAPQSGGCRKVLSALLLLLVVIAITYGRCYLRDKRRRGVEPASSQAAAEIPPRLLPLNQWVNDGPHGGEIELVVMSPADPNVVLAAEENSVHRSTDGGAAWKRVLIARSLDVTALAFSPDGKQAFAGGNGLYRSSDGGATWTEVPDVSNVTSVTVGEDAVFAAANDSILASTDGGNRWESRKVPTSTAGLRLAAGPQRVYATAGSSLFESIDGARSWRRLSFPEKQVQEIAIVPPSTLYVSTLVGMVRSADGGQTWTSVPKFATTKLYDLRSAANGVVIVQSDDGFFRSEDGGGSWTETSKPEDVSIKTLDLDRASGQTLIASAFDDRVYKSNDGGKSWSGASSGLAAMEVAGLVMLSGGRVAMETMTDVAVASRTEGWRTVLHSGRLSFSKVVGSIAAAGGDLLVVRGVLSHRVERLPAGETALSRWSDLDATAVAHHPSKAERFFASMGDGLAISDDGGKSWQTIAPLRFQELLFGPENRLYALTGGAVQWSDDEGRTWRKAPDLGSVGDIDLTSNGRLCAGGAGGVSCIRGSSVEQLREGLPRDEVTAIAAHPSNAAVLLAGTSGSGVYVTRDSGKNWSRFGPEGGPMHILGIVFDREDPAFVHVATRGESVYSIHTAW